MKRIIFLLSGLLLTLHVQAQRTEVGVNLFTSHYYGSLTQSIAGVGNFGDYLNYRAKQISFGGGIHLRYNTKGHWSFRSDLNYTRLSAADSNAVNDTFMLQRNLSFRNDVFELTGIAEYYFNDFGWDTHKRTFSPYVFGGISLFHHNPQAYYKGEWVNLQPLITEGQDLYQYRDKRSYSLMQFGVPIGAGLKFALNGYWRLGVELGWRFTFTNYLDDVGGTYADPDVLKLYNSPVAAALSDRSKERNPNFAGFKAGDVRDNNTMTDGYVFFGVNLSYVIWRVRCPKF